MTQKRTTAANSRPNHKCNYRQNISPINIIAEIAGKSKKKGTLSGPVRTR